MAGFVKLLCALLAAGTLVSRPAISEDPWFREEAAARGLLFEHRSGHRDRYLMPEIMAGGGALCDLDGDGDLDAYLVQSGGLEVPAARRPPNRLFRNRGEGMFEDVTETSGAGHRGYGTGVACGDVDRDGDIDLYVTNVGANALLRNDGATGTGGRFSFTDVTAGAGVGHDGWGASAAFFDYDGDGDLDLFVTNYLRWSADHEIDCFDDRGRRDYCSPNNYSSPAPDVLYRNEGGGPDGRISFTDVTRETGLDAVFGNGLGVLPGDFDGDGRSDLFVANDGMPDQLWINSPGGRFRDQALLWGCAVDLEGQPKAGMGVAAADIDDDGDLDLLVCNLVNESDSLYLNAGGYFRDHTAASGLAGVSRPFTRFGVAWRDFDNDGILDLFEANGRVARKGPPLAADPMAEPNLVFRGLGGGRFAEVRPRGGTAEPLYATSRAAAFGDVDGDGGVDVLVVNRDAPAHLLRNVVPRRGHWLALRLLNEHGSDALGATVEVAAGDRTFRREVRAASSYLASSDPRLHVGLGPADRVRRVAIRWPDGERECFGPFAAGGEIVLRIGTGRACGDQTRPPDAR